MDDVVKDRKNWTTYSFDEYTDEVLLPKLRRVLNAKETTLCAGHECMGFYSRSLKEWFQWLPREHMLILSYHELKHDPSTFRKRIDSFLGLTHDPHQIVEKVNSHDGPEKVVRPSCRSRDKLAAVFEQSNEALYALLEENPGPSMEQFSFPKFEAAACEVENFA